MDSGFEWNALLEFAKSQSHACILLSNGFEDKYGKYEIAAGFGAKTITNSLEELTWDHSMFGFLSYDLKNHFENLKSENNSWIEVPEVMFFEPELHCYKARSGEVFTNFVLPELPHDYFDNLRKPKSPEWIFSDRQDYLNSISDIRNDIENGTYYELNFCTEWKAGNASEFDPYMAFYYLNTLAPAPFSAFIKWDDNYLLCSSPERFLLANNDQIISQPIKGTRRRQSNPHMDAEAKTELMTSEKDRAENVMITDLVRNDISHFCIPGTVEVEELCGVHSFSHVHQMISTITGKMRPETSVQDIISSMFPMGSMTGAPKVKVMEYIEKYEDFKRGLYSGSVGYLEDGRMDLNVVIRSLQFNNRNKRIAYHTGGAITYDSIGELEFQECLDKASGMMAIFES
ncbi:MAG: anthranilate synthase component I family protein [Bacteroidetes bacterium]|nr:anthranilate synthase component I family protein [Bacteroidota bacterium]